MLRNYLIVAYRNLKRNKGYTFINVAGLAVGMTCCFLIGRWVQHELSYDDFHEKAERIYRITLEQTTEGRKIHRAVTPPALAPALERNFPEVREAVRLGGASDALVRTGGEHFAHEQFAFADSAFFEVFTFPFVRGNPNTALDEPNSLVLTRSAAQRYFGEENPLGKAVTVTDARGYTFELTVTGVMEDVPDNSHFTFDLLTTYSAFTGQYQWFGDDTWLLFGVYTYVLLPPGYEAGKLIQKLPALVDRHMAGRVQSVQFQFHLQPLTRIHLHSHLVSEFQANGYIAYVYIFSAVALMILLIACINFMNLATARSTQRATEVGVRKTVGAYRTQLAGQFMLESLLQAALAGVLAVVLVQLCLPLFNRLAGTTLSMGPLLWLGLPAVVLLVGLLAGSYPAFVLSAPDPAAVMKSTSHVGSPRGAVLRRGLVVAQFAVSIALIAGMAIVYQQLTYMRSKPLGFNEQRVIVMRNPASLQEQLSTETVKQELLRRTGIRSVTTAARVPTQADFTNMRVIPEGSSANHFVMWDLVGADYVSTLGMEIVKGRDFISALASDSSAFLVNETAVRRFGWEKPLGKTLRSPRSGEVMGQVVGVIKDFHYQSLHQAIAPGVFLLVDWPLQHLIIRLSPGDIPGTLDFLERKWNAWVPNRPFHYAFLDARYDALYRAEERLSRLIGIFALLAVFIACLGLFGLAAFAAERRTKEIGIRKILGASVPSIVALLSKDFLKLVGIAFVIAVPLAYWAMQRWLQDFAYRIELGPWVFIAAGVLALGIALATVSYQAIRAALANPVEALRDE